ncbi:ATP-binding protein [Haliscomenobacter hydrossis]|uniref:Microtubule-severing ATPase n=1 Tax=Haliscomenobacter hydrossis (strain ATCC 27775 / DSM 1100 / LMG 10767 / O) TaxID=760192 RepID=F4L3P4_HALH1|nr:ATP-binding protein [Haliscomenobacter hydrossis]AEE53994.1 Microtubule-severing ATPase [Haliscomenobacter hydrossis DSM 1100]
MELNDLEFLLEAVKASPDNLPLRKLLASALLKNRRFAEAEVEYKEALRMAPQDLGLQMGLATAFLEQEKHGMASVIMEDILALDMPPPQAWIIQARILLAMGNARDAQEAYDNAITLDPNLADAYLNSEISQKLDTEPEASKVRLGGFGETEEEDRIIEFERPKVSFNDVGGMEKVKEEIRLKIIHPLEHPEIYKAYGKKIGGGILLYGPPGCGKTHLARATAGQIKSNFMAVGINEILDMWLGQSEKNLHAIFQKARQIKPCVLFFDEVDALGANRSDMRMSAGRHLINQFLNELDGIEQSNDGVLVLAATNAPWHLDPAFRRPGRFDRIIFVPPPDEAGRTAILEIHLRDKPVKDVDYLKIAQKTPGFSGADLEAVIDIAIEGKMEESMRKGIPLPIETNDLLKAVGKHRATTTEWFSTAKNYALFSNESGQYDEVLKYLNVKK